MNRYRRSAQKTGTEQTVLNTDDSIYFVSSSESSPKKPNIISRKSHVLKRPPGQSQTTNSSSPSSSSTQSQQEQVVIFQQQQHQVAANSQLESSVPPSHQHEQVILPPTTTDQVDVQNGQSYKSHVYYLLDDGTLAVVDNSSLLPPAVDESSSILVHQSQLGGQQVYPGQLLQLDQSQHQHRLILPQMHSQQSFVVQQHPVHMQQLSMRVQQPAPLLRQRVAVKSKVQHLQKQQEELLLKQELKRQRKQKQLETVLKLKLETDEQQRLQHQQLREFEERQRLHQEHLKGMQEFEEQQRISAEQQAEENQLQLQQLKMELQERHEEQASETTIIPAMELDEVKEAEILTNEGQQTDAQEKQVALDIESRALEPTFESEKVDEVVETVPSQQLQEQDEECQQDQYVILQMGNKTLLLPVATFQEYCEAQQSDDVEKTSRFLAMIEQALGESNDSSDSNIENSETYVPLQDSNISNGFDSIQTDSAVVPDDTSTDYMCPPLPDPNLSLVSSKSESQEDENNVNNSEHILESSSSYIELNSFPVPESDAVSLFPKPEEDAESALVLSSSVSLPDDDSETRVINCDNTEGEYDYEQPPTKRLKEDEEVSKITPSNSPVAAQIKSQTEASTKKDNIKIFRCGTCTKEFRTQDLCMQHIFDVHKADPLKTHCDYRRTNETRYMCYNENCARSFGSLAEFEQHNLETHLSDIGGNSEDSGGTDSGTTEQRVSVPPSLSSAVTPSISQFPTEKEVSPTTAPELLPAKFLESSTILKSEPDCSQSSKNTEILAFPSSLDCSKCSKTLANLYYFLLHGLVHMSASSIDNNHWICQICRETFSSKPELTSHFLIHCQMSMGASSNSNSHSSTQGNITEVTDHGSHCSVDFMSEPNPGHPSTLSTSEEKFSDKTGQSVPSLTTASSIDSSKEIDVQTQNNGVVCVDQGVKHRIKVINKKLLSTPSNDTQIQEPANTSNSFDVGVANTIIKMECDTNVDAEQNKSDLPTIISTELGENSSERTSVSSTEAGSEAQPVCRSVPSEEVVKTTQNVEPADGDLKTGTVVKVENFTDQVSKVSESDEKDGVMDSQTAQINVDDDFVESTRPSASKRRGSLSQNKNEESENTIVVNVKSEVKIGPINDLEDIKGESNPKEKDTTRKRGPRGKRRADFNELPRRRTRLSAKEVFVEDLSEKAKIVTTNGVKDSLIVNKSSDEKPVCNNSLLIRVMQTRRGSKTNIPVIPHDDLMDTSTEASVIGLTDSVKVEAVESHNASKNNKDEIGVVKSKRGRPKKKPAEIELRETKLVESKVSQGKDCQPSNERKTRNSLKLVNGNKTASNAKVPFEIQVNEQPNSLPENKVVATRRSRSQRQVSTVEMKKSLIPDSEPLPSSKTTKLSKFNKNNTSMNVESKVAQVSAVTTTTMKRGRKSKTVSRNFAGDEPEFEAGPSKILRNGSSSSSSTLVRRKDRRSFGKGMQVEDFTNPLSRTVVQETFMNIYKKMKEKVD